MKRERVIQFVVNFFFCLVCWILLSLIWNTNCIRETIGLGSSVKPDTIPTQTVMTLTDAEIDSIVRAVMAGAIRDSILLAPTDSQGWRRR
jgi:hypothetical protein